jgi:hypothetical protein
LVLCRAVTNLLAKIQCLVRALKKLWQPYRVNLQQFPHN